MTQETAPASPATILVVEDSRTQALELKLLLEEQGYNVRQAENGKQGLESAMEAPPDLILSDIEMPEMTGYQLCEAAKKTDNLNCVPVILLTSLSDAEDILRGLNVNADSYVTKPYNPYFLLSKIQHLLENPILEKPDRSITREGIELRFRGKRYVITTPPEKMLSLMLSTYEDSVLKNYELSKTQEALEELTDKLEEKVAERTASLKQEVAERTATGQELAETVKRLKRAMQEIIQAMVATLRIRDPYTADHQSRVSWLATAIAREVGMEKHMVDGMRMACMIHDIGKIAVPLDILNKPGRLSAIEFALIKTHPEVGHDILKSVEFPWPIAEIVLQHHERLDGTGYPNGLSGDQILREAKILAVADVVEAMSSHRPYRAGLGIDLALEEIHHKKGTAFDPEAVEVCIHLFREKGFTFD
ncbi:MAG: response regulator [Proteobacteria bacterium]|nr:response regulator [Pseudomonadota bacterium]